MAVYCTEENKKDECLAKALRGLIGTVNFDKHRLVLCVNGHTKATENEISWLKGIGLKCTVIDNGNNFGTARAINQAWKLRQRGEHCIKMDDDIVINSPGWVDELEEAIRRDPAIGQVGLKRKDCWEWPGHDHADWRSELHMLPHTPGEPWRIVEKVKHVIGSCVMHSAALLDKCGGLFQFGKYGYDDVIYSHKCHIAGFYSCFLPHINIDHIDPGDTPYQSWKEKHSSEHTEQVIRYVKDMYNFKEPHWHPFE